MSFLDNLSTLMNFDKPKAVDALSVSTPAKKKTANNAAKKISSRAPAGHINATQNKKMPTVRVAGTRRSIPAHSQDAVLSAPKKRVLKKNTKNTASDKPTVSPYEERTDNLDHKRKLVCAPSEHCFWVCDGRVLADLRELGQALAEIEDEVFNHHVTDERHDFAQWVEDILCDGDCAKKLRETRSRPDAKRVVLEALDLYN